MNKSSLLFRGIMLIFINLIYYHLSPNECYLKGPNASFDLGEKERERSRSRERERERERERREIVTL